MLHSDWSRNAVFRLVKYLNVLIGPEYCVPDWSNNIAFWLIEKSTHICQVRPFVGCYWMYFSILFS